MWGGQSEALLSYRDSSFARRSDLKAQRVLTCPILPRDCTLQTHRYACHTTLGAPCHQGTPTCSISYV